MANIFLSGTDDMPRDVETAIMLENANRIDIGNAVAYTDGEKVFINTDDKLAEILPAYSYKMLKWLLWHERMHLELKHHDRFFKYLDELEESKCEEEFQLSKEEVNIIMDILVHDSLIKMFPELVETAVANYAQMRNRNSLKYTFKTHTLEEMLSEYKTEREEKSEGGKGTPSDKAEDEEDRDGMGTPKETKDDDKMRKDESKTGRKPAKEKGHSAGGSDEKPEQSDDAPEEGVPEDKDDVPEPEDEHELTDWSKLDHIDPSEFINSSMSEYLTDKIATLRRKKFRLGKLTETLNGLVTSTRARTYAKPSPIKVNGGVILKGSRPGKTKLYLCFDASGSMGSELETFKEIISKSIPQAMETPCEWFTNSYGKGKFKDILGVYAWSGFNDDGDRVIELCWKAEQAGYSPIGVTDGGGQLSWSKKYLVQLRRTILVGQNKRWLEMANKVNPKVQILDI